MIGRLVIGHGNVYAANRTPARAVAALRGMDADSIGINEGNHLLGRLRRMRGYRLACAPGLGRDRETPVLTRSSLPVLGEITQRISRASIPLRWAPDRWLTAALFSHPLGPIAHVNVHLNAVVTGLSPATPRVREYAASTEAIGSLLEWLVREGYIPVVSGDVNMTRTGGSAVPWSAHAVLEASGLEVRSRGVDVIAYPRRLELDKFDTIETDQTGADHPFLVATFKAARP